MCCFLELQKQDGQGLLLGDSPVGKSLEMLLSGSMSLQGDRKGQLLPVAFWYLVHGNDKPTVMLTEPWSSGRQQHSPSRFPKKQELVI